MKNARIYSAGLVASQFSLIILICARALPLKPGISPLLELLPGILLVSAACGLAVVAAVTLQLRNFSVLPEPVKQGELITHGPYRYIRHPMYTAVLIGCAGLILFDITLISGVLLFVLCAILLLKIHREESLLQATYSGYNHYQKHTGVLLPRFSSYF